MNQKQGPISLDGRDFSFEDNLKYVDFRFINFFFKKYYRYLILITLIFSGISFKRFQSLPKIYQGQFQIVVSNDGESQRIPEGVNLNLFDNSNKDLKTQLVILKTPSVLFPAYEEIKSLKVNKGIQSDNWNFQDFKNNLNIDVIDGTNVLQVKYKSEYKDLILPALSNISSLYKRYSYKEKIDKLEKSKIFLDKQISSYKEKILEKLAKIEEFNRKYNLDYSIEGKKIILNTQSIRNKLRNDIREVEQKIISFNDIYDNDEEFIYNSEKLFTSQYLADIQKVEQQIIINKAILKDNDLSFKALNLQKKALINKLKKETIGHLKAQKLLLEASLQAIFRPLEVENEYRNLIGDYILSEQVLIDLVSQEKTILLEASKENDSWEVITDPKVINQPISPNLIKIITSGSVIGFFSSFIIFYFIERRKKIVFNSGQIESKIGAEIILNLPLSQEKEWLEILTLSSEGILNFGANKKISFLVIGDFCPEIQQKFLVHFKKVIKNDLSLTKDPVEAKNSDIQLILASYGELNHVDLNKIQTKLSLKANNITGIILISKND